MRTFPHPNQLQQTLSTMKRESQLHHRKARLVNRLVHNACNYSKVAAFGSGVTTFTTYIYGSLRGLHKLQYKLNLPRSLTAAMCGDRSRSCAQCAVRSVSTQTCAASCCSIPEVQADTVYYQATGSGREAESKVTASVLVYELLVLYVCKHVCSVRAGVDGT